MSKARVRRLEGRYRLDRCRTCESRGIQTFLGGSEVDTCGNPPFGPARRAAGRTATTARSASSSPRPASHTGEKTAGRPSGLRSVGKRWFQGRQVAAGEAELRSPARAVAEICEGWGSPALTILTEAKRPSRGGEPW